MAVQDEQPEREADESPASELELEVNEEVDSDDGDDFTLQTLSEAYADVMASEDDSEDTSDDASDDQQEDASPVAPEAADENDDSPCPVSPESIVESILFVGAPSDVKLTSRKIAAVLRDVSPKEVSQIVKKLNTRYETQDAAWRIQGEKGTYRMVLHESMDSFKDEYFGRNREIKLNQSAIDVLAVVAYHQPATKEQVEKIRGKNCGSILNQLVKRQLLDMEKSTEKPVTKLYSTTDRFLDLFGLTEIQDLPQSHEVADIEDLAD